MTKAQKALADLIKAWDALPGGQSYRPHEVAQWLRDDMAPAVRAAREVLRMPAPKV